MSIVGTRPPLPNEWEAYELHHRARLGGLMYCAVMKARKRL